MTILVSCRAWPLPTSVRTFWSCVAGLHDAVLFKRCHLYRAEHAHLLRTAGNHQRGFGESVTWMEGAGSETTGGKGRRKPFQGVGADWLCAVVSHIPTAEVESFALFGSNSASAQFIGEIGAAANRWLCSAKWPGATASAA